MTADGLVALVEDGAGVEQRFRGSERLLDLPQLLVAQTAGEMVREAVLELTYTAHDMAPFARDMGHIDAAGDVLPPFVWDQERRLHLRAKLDAVFFHLYGVTDRDDVRYVFSTFPIVEREETAAYGSYRCRDLCLAWMNALAAGDPDAEIAL